MLYNERQIRNRDIFIFISSPTTSHHLKYKYDPAVYKKNYQIKSLITLKHDNKQK